MYVREGVGPEENEDEEEKQEHESWNKENHEGQHRPSFSSSAAVS